MDRQLKYVIKKRTKAFKVFEKAKQDLLNAIEDANLFFQKNSEEIQNLFQEINEKKQVNFELDNHVKALGKSVSEIEKVLNPQ